MVKLVLKKNRQFPAHALAKAAGVERLIFCTDLARVCDPVAVAEKLPPGSIIICRDYDHADRETYARKLCAATRENRQFLLVAGDVALARKVGADGVHLPEYMLSRRQVLSGFRLITAACHNRAALRRAERLGVDFALVAPVFSTRSHVGAPALGLHRFARLTFRTPVRVAALGGVNVATAKKLRPLKLAALAGIDGFLSDKSGA
ncbi:thiamine phosphate synthase [Kordiimonas aestuarii]|uniref:thiamine phosphate synthase n=1 Tax=Kordiimonas aestuarii TaxID=1005925 RepID=UPI0021CF69D3|nr:thiamine phosphate synthase [Kordiimonas aestuarii]